MLSSYCERVGQGFWDEPLNAASNAGFILVALLFYVELRRARAADWPVAILTAVVFAIGIGSFLFHTRPGPVTVMADVIPIQLFILGYLFLAVRRFFDDSRAMAAAAVAIFMAADILSMKFWPNGWRGTAAYLPALGALFAVGALLIGRAHLAAWRLGRSHDPAHHAAAGLKAAFSGRAILISGIVFSLSLVFRAIDRPFCGQFVHGTHFLWHLCNALVLFILMRTALRHGPAAPPAL